MRTEINTRIEAVELQVVAEFYDTYLTVVDAMAEVVVGEKVVGNFSVVEELKLALGMTVSNETITSLDSGAVVTVKYSVNKRGIDASIVLEADMEVYQEMFAAYSDVVHTYGMIMVDTAKRIKPLVLDAIEIKKQMNVELASAREELTSQHKILKGSL